LCRLNRYLISLGNRALDDNFGIDDTMTDEKREEKRIAIEERRKHLFEGVEPGKAT
jgi:hypothetical protein